MSLAIEQKAADIIMRVLLKDQNQNSRYFPKGFFKVEKL